MPNLFDHLVVVAIVVALPLWGRLKWPEFVRKTTAGVPGVRTRMYVSTMIEQWALLAALIAQWIVSGRSFAAIGFAAPRTAAFGVCCLLAVTATWFAAKQMRRFARPRSDWSRIAPQLDPVVPLLPHTPAEWKLFVSLSVTAGVCEEALFRGFLMWWLLAYVPLVPAFAIAAAAFGLAHAYQGKRGVMKTGVVGLVMLLFYWLGGSLWPPMILHAVIDIQSGWIGWRYVLGRAAQTPGVPAQSEPSASR